MINLEASPTSLPANGISTATLTADMTKNSNGADMSVLGTIRNGTGIIFTTSLGTVGSSTIIKTTSNGIATAILTSSTSAGTANITASAPPHTAAATANATVQFVSPAGLKLLANPQSIPADGTSTSTLAATVLDVGGNPVPDGTIVTFTTTAGSVGSTTITKPTVGGVAIATLTSSATAGVATVTASADGLSDITAVFFTAPGVTVGQIIEEEINGSGTLSAGNVTGGNVIINATGSHTVTVAEYSSNPGGPPIFGVGGAFVDIHLDSTTGVNSLAIEFCPADEGTVIYFWNDTSWVRASDQVFDADLGCLVVTIAASTTPALNDLVGAVFAFGIEGDVNTDGKIDGIDARICLRAALGLITLTSNQRQICDVDNDSAITEANAIDIAKYSLGLLSSLANAAAAVAGVGLGLVGLLPLILRRCKAKYIMRVFNLFLFVMVLSLSGCVQPPAPMIPSGTAGLLAVVTPSSIHIRVQDMPDGGLASLEAKAGGFTFNSNVIEIVEIVPKTGWRLLASLISNPTGEGRFVVVNPTAGVGTGDVLSMTIRRKGSGSTGVSWDKRSLTLGDALDQEIPSAQYLTVVEP